MASIRRVSGTMESHCTSCGLVVLVLAVLVGAGRNEQDRRDAGDPDCFRNVSSLIAHKGYPVEEYNVTTIDGYILGVQRIPTGRTNALRLRRAPKKVVFLQYGLLGSSAHWVLSDPSQSLGFILADAGYDVWLANVRGSTYSDHVRHDRHSKEFWDFSVDEMIEHDLPEMLNFVLNRTRQEKLFYVGHSQGSTIMFGLLSQSPEYNDKVELFCALGPVTTLTNTRSPLRYLSPFGEDIGAMFNIFGQHEVLPSDFMIKLIADTACQQDGSRDVYGNILFLIRGPENTELSVTPVFLCHAPAGTSVRTMVHYFQILQNERFQKYDFGENRNQLIYGQSTPPGYNVSRAAVPVALFWSEGDCISDPRDVSLLRHLLPNVVLNFKVLEPKFSHQDFVTGIHASSLVYEPMMRLMEGYEPTAR